jgi:hypothetical protein
VKQPPKDQRADAYEQHLQPEELEQLHALLLQPGLRLSDVRALAPPHRGGPWDGSKPSKRLLSEIGTRLRTEQTLLNLEATAKVMDAVHHKLKGIADEEVLDSVISLVGQEVIQKTLSGEDPKNRTAATRLLLKRADQKLAGREMALSEKRFRRETCELFMDWFQDARAREIASNTEEPKSDRVEKLGKLIFKEDW